MNPENWRRRAAIWIGLTVACGGAGAAEQCSALMNLDVPATTEGLYVNFITGVSGTTEASVPGFDLDIYASANSEPADQLKFYWGSSSTGGAGVASVGDTYAVLGTGHVIDSNALFTRAAFTGDTAAWRAGTSGYLGVRFRNESSGVINYGWLLLSTTATLGFPATIRRWCYNDSGAAITTPGDALFADDFDG